MKPKNPFVIRGYAGAEYFCDRQKEAAKFISRHGLTAASSASFALNDLRAHDLVCETDRGWIVYDRLFGEWLSRFPS